MKANACTGMSTLFVLALKRDKIRLTCWLAAIILMVFLLLATFKAALSGPEEIQTMMIMLMSNPTMRALLSPSFSVGLGGFLLMRASTTIAVVIALFGAFTIIRHTRKNEDSSCEDYVASTVVGRHASLAAALLLSIGIYIVLAWTLSAAFLIFGESPAGSFAAGFAFASMYLAFSGLAAIAAQLYQNAREASAGAGIMIAGLFLFSALGNMFGEVAPGSYELHAAWPVWLSPFGWYQQVQAFADNNIIPLLLAPVLFVICSALAMYFENRRDVGAGIIPAKIGRREARKSLLSPLGLAWRLQQKSVISWTISLGLVGLLFGSALGEFSHAMSELEISAAVFRGDIGVNETFILTIIGFSASFLLIFIVQAVIRMYGEEKDGLVDPLLATRVSRLSWVLSHITVVSMGTIMMLLVMGVFSGLSTLADADIRFLKLLEGALIQAPALFAVAGFCMFSYGIFPKQSGIITRTAMALSLIAGPFFGPMFDLPQWMLNVSVFTHIPGPGDVFTAVPLLVLMAISLVFFTAGIMLFNKRDINRI